MKYLAAAALVALAGCADEPPSDPAADAEAIAKAERMSAPPRIMIEPQPITFADIEENDLFGAGCNAMIEGADDPVFLAQEKKGWIKLEGRIVELTSDRSSDPLPYDTWTKYIGLENWLEMERDAARKTRSGDETVAAPGEIVIHDSADRVVFRSNASIDCGA